MYSRVLASSYKGDVPSFKSLSPFIESDEIAYLDWEEHCVECSPPYCYNHCTNYISRLDKKCVRLQGGIMRVNNIDGPLGYGIKCVFRKWAKLETKWTGRLISKSNNVAQDHKWNFWGKIALSLAKFTSPISPTLKLYGAYIYIRNKVFSKVTPSYTKPNCFYINCFLIEKNNVPLMVQIDYENKVYLTKVIQLKKGENSIFLDVDFQIPLGARIFVTPLEDSDTILYFRWLDFFKGAFPLEDMPAPKVKVVAWDLDNTLWKGTLVNGKGVELNQQAIALIKELDRRGILNTIISKNDEKDALAELEKAGIKEYFLYPAINWGQKSENLKTIAKYLNLGINSFAFIDDNIRERSEVSRALPSVRVYADTEIAEILTKEEFNVPITETSLKRRLLYMEDAKRISVKEAYGDDYDAFLRSLQMELIQECITSDNKMRCYELLSRSNQLNLSTNRYSIEEYDSLLNDGRMICKAFRVHDKYGDYGVVAFISINVSETNAFINDLVISCRIAKKKVEKAIIYSIKDELIKRGVKKLNANLILTKKNSPLIEVFSQLPFEILEQNEKRILYSISNINNLQDDEIIKLNSL